jgi:predicted tellurium resistance membrane protein TerC
MEFNPSPINITELLVMTLAVVAAVLIVMKKRYDTNVPLLFYFFLILFTNLSERELNPYVLYTGLALALILRFEFMGTGFAKMIAYFTAASLCVIIYLMMQDVMTA